VLRDYVRIEGKANVDRRSALDSLDIARHVVDVLDERKAENIVLLDLRPDTVIADFFVICTATSDRQIRALVDYVKEALKDDFDRRPFAVEGTPESGWQLLDYGDVVVHFFLTEVRRYYDLEGLWHHANVMVSIQ
jgi:ribosome-associated protein